jgi:hypothetical protein
MLFHESLIAIVDTLRQFIVDDKGNYLPLQFHSIWKLARFSSSTLPTHIPSNHPASGCADCNVWAKRVYVPV